MQQRNDAGPATVAGLATDPAATERWRARRAERAGLGPVDLASALAEQARLVRRDIVTTIDAAGAGHIGGDMSVTDIMVTLFEHVLDIDPAQPNRPDRDRFVLSKGHCAAALYSALAHVGYFSADELPSFMAPHSALNGHPNRNKVPGVETNTGPLGHGLPFAVGQALASRMRNARWRVVVVVGDGELQEGSNWEALMTAGHQRLERLMVIVDRNTLQQGARTEDTVALDPLDQRLAAFGCEVRTVDGHDHLALVEALGRYGDGRPVAVIANTVKGRGLPFAEDRVEWHHKVPTAEQVAIALEELS